MNDRVAQAVARRRFQTTLLTLFSGIATLLAVVGIYGLLTYSVRRRTAEIGIRMALGSSRIRVAGLILQEGLGLTGAGALIGLAATLLSTKLLAGFLYGVSQIDPPTFFFVPLLLFLVALAACRCVLDSELEGKSYRSDDCTATRMIGSQMAQQAISKGYHLRGPVFQKTSNGFFLEPSIPILHELFSGVR